MKRTLDLGCGSNKRAGTIGADITQGSAADVIVNLEQFFRLGIEWLANIYPELYESFFAFIIPARDIVFRLKVIK